MAAQTLRRPWASSLSCCFFFQAEDGIRDVAVTGVQTCALPISMACSLRPIEIIFLQYYNGPKRAGHRDPMFMDKMNNVFICLITTAIYHHLKQWERDRKSVVKGKSVDLGGRRIIKKKNKRK